MENKFFYIESYGCSANLNNSEIIKGLLIQAGLEITNNPKLAGVLILNTCVVKGPTEEKINFKIKQLSKLNKPLIIAGCMPEVRKHELSKIPNIFLLGTHHFKEIPKLIKKISENKLTDKDKQELISLKDEIKLNLPKISDSKKIGITQISEGCLGNCTYCIVKLAKGKLFSYPEEKILKNVEQDLKSGCREIWITSQDNASYGLDRKEKKHKLPSLLKKILKLDYNFKLRIGMMDPNNILPILDELIEVYKHEKMFKFLHMPIQSGSNKILKDMNRLYNVTQIMKIRSHFKKQIPNLTLSTDIIVGYPTETEKDFNDTLKLIKQIKPDIINISKFWPRKGTEAAKLAHLPINAVLKRTKKLVKLNTKNILENNKKYLNKELPVLIDKPGFKLKNQLSWLARADNYKLVIIKSDIGKNLLGRHLKVRITDAKGHYLTGEKV